MRGNIFLKTIAVLALFTASITQQALGQITDDFSDGDFTNNPTWSGTNGNYIVNASSRLQLNAPASGVSFLSSPFSIPANHNTQWEFVVSQNFLASNQNCSRIYLMADSPDPSLVQNGYFLQFGETNSNDPIDLFRIVAGSPVSIARGTLAYVASPFNIRVRVTRSSIGGWELLADNTAGTNFISQFTVTDNTTQTSSYFILRSTYSAGNITNFSYDDFVINTTQAPDITAPSVSSVNVVTSTEIQLNFSEALDATNALSTNEFVLNDTVLSTSATFEDNNTKIKLTFAQAMINGRVQKINFPALSDPSANVLPAGNQNFLFFQAVEPQLHDLVINEIYADPSPSIGLPEFEFVEIYNRSEHPFQLENWQLTDGTTTATLTTRILLPGEFLIITPNAANAQYSAFGPTMPVATFPSLNNSGDHIQLKSPAGIEIDGQTYALSWYHDDDRDAGGFSLELIDPTNFCRGAENWKASSHAVGGTPGHANAALQITPDLTGPKLMEVLPKASQAVTLKFDEPLSATLPSTDVIQISPSIEKTNLVFSNATNTEIDLTFADPLDSAVTYTLSVSDILDCPGNTIQNNFSSASFRMDMVAPLIESLDVIDQHTIRIQLSEKILPSSVSKPALAAEAVAGDFTLEQSDNKKSLTLHFADALINGRDYSIIISALTDYAGNIIATQTKTLRFFQQQAVLVRDIIINELLADQSPVVGLPEGEFIELYNRTEKAVSLAGWAITDGSTIGTFPDKIILPHEYVILCSSAMTTSFAAFGNTIGLSTFPSLNNSGDHVILKNAEGVSIDSIHYYSSWYQNGDKEDGGWSLERINPNDFCGEHENWKAGDDETGGTPGKINSVFAFTEDVTAPDLLTVTVHRADSLSLHFDERLSVASSFAGNFVFEPALEIDTAAFTGSDKRSIGFKLQTNLDSLTQYHLQAQNIFDCPGNVLPADSANLHFKLDNIRPEVKSVMTLSASSVVVSFSERIGHASNANFSIDNVLPASITIRDAFSVELVFDPPFINGKNYQLKVSAISDLAGNVMNESTHDVLHFEPHPLFRKDVVISEIFADPSPVVGLPETEFVEIYNRSENPIQLKNWIISDETHEARLNDHIILPGSFLVLTISSKAFQFENSHGVSSFPGLTNSGEPLILKDSVGMTIDSVFYSDDWYHDSEKEDGGFSLELIDPDNICSEAGNWTASEDPAGGTPGKTNSVDAEKPDLSSPEIVSVFALNPDTIVVEFNEKLTDQLPSVDNVSINPTNTVTSIAFVDLSKRGYRITLATSLQKRIRYQVNVNNVFDCAGNALKADGPLFFALPENAVPGDIVINEILFNPRPTGIDFAEFFNRSEKFINLKDWTCANIVNDTIVNKKSITLNNYILEPGQFLAVTADPNILKGEYLQSAEERIGKAILPSLSDDEGSLVLLDESETLIDTLFYNDDLHSPFLKSSEGVSLERIDAESPASNKNNWQSASASSGYATPGLPNSNAFQNSFEQAVSVNPEIFSPDSGSPDFAMISYNLEDVGYVANIKIVNQQGRLVRRIAENELLGTNGFFTWRGETAQGSRAANGSYMVWFEMFDQSGNVITIKKRVVVTDLY